VYPTPSSSYDIYVYIISLDMYINVYIYICLSYRPGYTGRGQVHECGCVAQGEVRRLSVQTGGAEEVAKLLSTER